MAKSYPNTSLLSYEETNAGLIVFGTISAGTPPVDASMFIPGARVLDLSTGIAYTNDGSTAVPSWNAQAKSVTVALTAAQLIAMYAAPIAIIPAIAGKAIILDSMEFVMTRTATAFTSGGVVNLQYAATANGAGTKVHADIAAAVVTGAAGVTYTARIPLVQSDIATASINGIGVFISNQTAAFATGTGTAVVTVKYHVV